MHVQFLNTQSKYSLQIYKAHLTEALELAWESIPAFSRGALKNVQPELSLSFVGPRQMKKINLEARSVNETTDVLSFPLHEFSEGKTPAVLDAAALFPLDESAAMAKFTSEQPSPAAPPELAINLGDIVICPERATAQATEYGHSFERELIFLALHGFLHLVGFDHAEAAGEKKMRKLQSSLMDKLGLSVAETAVDRVLQPGPQAELVSANAQIATPKGFKSGFVAIVGRPNAGKSTLLNQLSGEYLAITSHKAQTTRTNIRCIIDTDKAQCIFIDTPGLHSPKHKLGSFMMDGALGAIKDSDVVLFIMDASKRFLTKHELELAKQAEAAGRPVLLAINKIDLVDKPELLPLIKRIAKEVNFTAIVPISALKGDGSALLLEEIIKCLPEGPRFYAQEDYTDQTERQLAAELIREKILRFTNQEIPHGTGVIITSFEEDFLDGTDDEYARSFVKIQADILCERETHKIILIGKNGSMLKRIGSSARISIEEMLGCKVFLELFVKVRPDWRNRPSILGELGYQMPQEEKSPRKKN